ncbi:type II toxin-antitoxin system RelE/ParE family toxin [Roseomonas genomospecies 6]|uniref:Type II toxin-antitoxin system RelE/ParE family toxin n=1 Tax=Roseomonas genomospecies 6 TaxID=214106 RepID=A0A9W7NIL0_9PROT|nr:type II toxin-antitoxin system RelE/ParE family toxin [Roseomonas genomospecies 6]KAA0679736.1 type II toxin-antitoxin system RelE/ParE family toxin [Roseomonas genomospecies 6]
MVAYRVTDAAKMDFRMVLRETGERFGAQQRGAYKELIAKAVEMVAEDPDRGGSWDRGRIVPGLRAFHLEQAAGRRGAAAHTLYYTVERLAGEPQGIVILRLLHERMEPDRRIPQSV